MDTDDAVAKPAGAGHEREPFSFRSGNWLGKALALGMVVAFAAAVIGYWEPQRTPVGIIGIALLVGMALVTAVWFRVRVDPSRRRVTRYAVLLGVVPIFWRSYEAGDFDAVRLSAYRGARRWQDLWYISLRREDGKLITLDWQAVSRTAEPTEPWELAQRIAAALDLPAENKGIMYRR